MQGTAVPEREIPFPVEVAAPLPKGDRATFLLEKLTELGVTRFVPLRTRRNVVHPRETKLDKLERTVVEASKQCGRNVLMAVGPLTDWEDYCSRADLLGTRLLAHVGEHTAVNPGRSPAASGYVLAVGPEGGFTEEEVEAARAASWHVVGLGPRVLRVETAALVLAAWVSRPPAAGV